MSKKGVIYTFIGIAVFIGLVSGIYCASTYQERKIQQLQKQIAYLKQEIIPIRFKILDRRNDTIYFSMIFYDLDRRKVFYYDDNGVKQERVRVRMPGNELAFDFIVVPVGGRFVAFPYKVFTDVIPAKDGIVLFRFYDRNDFPQIYWSENNSPAFNAGMKALFKKIKSGQVDDIQGIFGSVVQDIKGIKQFEVGRIYRIVIHPAKGGIEIVEE